MIFLRRLLDLPFLVILMGICASSMYLPAAHALALGQFAVARSFFYSGIIILILTAMIAIATASYSARNAAHSQLASMIAAYLVLPIILAVPLHQAVPDLSFGGAWFEMLSCFTTTGATVFDTPGAMPPPVHFWRALVGWFGGYYTLVMLASVLAPMGLGGVDLLGKNTRGGGMSGGQAIKIAEPSQRAMQVSIRLFPVYAGLTLILWVALLVAGDSALIALCHAMGTLSTSGISPLVGLSGTASGMVGEGIIFICLGLAITRRLWPSAGIADRTLKIWQDPELRLAVGILVLVTVVITLRLASLAPQGDGWQNATGLLRGVWGAAFTTLSFLTTTGFQSASWPGLGSPGLFLLGLAIIGGGVATTAGGIKLLRVYALLRHGERELERIVHPHSIGGHGPVARRLRREGAYMAWIFFMVFGLSIAAFTAALTLTGLTFQDALILAIACLSTTGQLAASVGDAPISYADLGGAPLAILGVAMVLGRLEILAIFALFAPKSWSR
jgi:trk system potassium uptake protein